MHCIYNNDFNNATPIKLESLYWSTNTLMWNSFIFHVVWIKKFTIFCEANQTCYNGYFLTDFCLSFRNCGCTLTKNCFRFFMSWRRSRDVISKWYSLEIYRSGLLFRNEWKKESSAGYSDARPLPLEMLPIGRSVKEHMQRFYILGHHVVMDCSLTKGMTWNNSSTLSHISGFVTQGLTICRLRTFRMIPNTC